MKILIILSVIFIFILIGIFLIKSENRKFRVTEYSYKNKKLKRKLTIAVLSDLHNYSYGRDNERLLEKLRDIGPDLVISAGDMVEAGRFVKNPRNTVAFLDRLSQEFTFLYGCGNHEEKLLEGEKYKGLSEEFFRALKEYGGVHPLRNENTVLEDMGICVYGLSLERDYFKKVILNRTTAEHIEQLVGRPMEEKLNILIGHNPDQLEAYSDWGADVVLAGHIHGGMIATPWHRGLISPRFIPLPKYDWGKYEKGKTTMFLSRGLGNHTIHIRIFNRAEIMLLKFSGTDSK